MRCRVKLLSMSPNKRAADGSYIPRDVVRDYLASEECKRDLAARTMFVGLTHRRRNLQANPIFNQSLKTTVGKDDAALLVDSPSEAPVGYIESMDMGNDDWLYADIVIFPTDGADNAAAECIKRITYLLNAGSLVGISAVILGYWKSDGSGDVLRKIVAIRGADFTLNSSFKGAGITEIYDDEGDRIDSAERNFSEVSGWERAEVKMFSISEKDLPKGCTRTSKVEGQFTTLMLKSYSIDTTAEIIDDKTFSVATLKERVRYAKFSPRMRFRKLVIEYKQAVKSFGGPGNLDPDTERIMKSLFATDVLDIVKTIHPDIMSGKQINTMLGCSSLGRSIREASQKLQLPYRYAMQEIQKTGKISPMRYKKIQDAYVEFIKALTDEVFGSNSEIPDDLNEEDNAEN